MSFGENFSPLKIFCDFFSYVLKICKNYLFKKYVAPSNMHF